MKIDIIAGARPNFVKIAPVIEQINKANAGGTGLDYRLIHTGQHSDSSMSDVFFDQLDIPAPDVILKVDGTTHAAVTGQIMLGYEKVLQKSLPVLCLVVGDVTSTMACAIVARKVGVSVAHVEGGLRSGDWSMPEEINRVVTDSITDFFFTTSEHANENLRKSGVTAEKIFFVGNTMIDTLLKYQHKLSKPEILNGFSAAENGFFVLTLHRPANVDDSAPLEAFLGAISEAAQELPVIFPVHPRTQKQIAPIVTKYDNIRFTAPMSYLEFIYMIKHARAVITDSGGITEETTVLGVPCMTLRNNTERPETVLVGTNELLGTDPRNIAPAFEKLLRGKWKKGKVPPLWDGHSSERIVEKLIEISRKKNN